METSHHMRMWDMMAVPWRTLSKLLLHRAHLQLDKEAWRLRCRAGIPFLWSSGLCVLIVWLSVQLCLIRCIQYRYWLSLCYEGGNCHHHHYYKWYQLLTLSQKVVSELKLYLLNLVMLSVDIKSLLEKQMTESWMEFWPYSYHFWHHVWVFHTKQFFNFLSYNFIQFWYYL